MPPLNYKKSTKDKIKSKTKKSKLTTIQKNELKIKNEKLKKIISDNLNLNMFKIDIG
jgi:hypothetical protein